MKKERTLSCIAWNSQTNVKHSPHNNCRTESKWNRKINDTESKVLECNAGVGVLAVEPWTARQRWKNDQCL